MAQPQLLRGSWADLAARADEFKDRDDLVLIVPGDALANTVSIHEGKSLAEVLNGRTGLVNFEPSDLSEDTGRKFAALLVEKYKRDQL